MPARWDHHTTVLMIIIIISRFVEQFLVLFWTVASVGLFELTEGLSLSVAARLDADHPAGPRRPRQTPRRLH